MQPEEFIKAYGAALASQDWKNVAPLVAEAVSVTFSDGSVHIGKVNVQAAFEKNFSIIKNEEYSIYNVRWLSREENFAVYFLSLNGQAS